MEPDAKYTLVGTAVVGIISLLCVFIVWLSGSGDADVKYFKIYFKEENLSGLQTDSDVTMKGIKVGSVVSYGISEKNVEQVEVTIKVGAATPVKVDTRAVIRRNVLTGLAQIELTKGTQLSDLLTEVQESEEYPIIAEGRSQLEQFASNIPELISSITDLSDSFKTLFSEQNLKSVSITLGNFEKVSTTLASSDKDIQQTLANLNKLTNELANSSSKINSLVGKADQKLEITGGELNQAIKDIASASKTVSSAVESTAQVISIETQNISQSLRTASESISAVSEKFENPKAIITGPSADALGPGEVILKNKR